MGIVFRQSVKSTIVIFTGNVIGALVHYFSTYVFKDDMQEFGFARTLINIGTIAIMVVLMGGSSTMQIYAQKFEARDARKKLLITFCSIMPLSTTLLLLPAYLFFKEELIHLFKAEDWQYLYDYYLWIPTLILLWAYLILFEAYMVSQHKTAQSLIMREVILRVLNLLTLAAFYYQLIDFRGFIIATVLSYGLAALLLVYLSARTEGFGFSLKWDLFNKQDYKEMLHFSWHHLLTGVSLFLIGYMDSLLLAVYGPEGMASVPVYGTAILIGLLMYIPFRAMTNATFPVLNRAYIEKDWVAMKDTFTRSSLNIQVVGIAMALIIGVNLNNAVAILPQGKGYDAVLPLTLILILGRLADMFTGMNNEVISISNLYRFNSRLSFALVIVLFLLYRILIPEFGSYGAAWGTSAAMIVFNVIKLFYLKHKLQLQPFSGKVLLVLLAGIIAGGVAYIIPTVFHPVADTIIRAGVAMAIYIPLLLWWKASDDINNFFGAILRKRRLF